MHFEKKINLKECLKSTNASCYSNTLCTTFSADGIKVSVNDFIIKAVATALQVNYLTNINIFKSDAERLIE